MAKQRDTELADRMSEHEALMWNVEKDPWLNPNGASLTLLDQPVDRELFRRTVRAGVVGLPRLYQRVVPGLGRLSTPAWVPDPEFDFDHHVREIHLPPPGTLDQLFELAVRLYEEPLDRTRPLWRFVTISGLEDGRGAIWAMIHHSVADGIGQLRMAELYQQLSRDQEPPPEVDLESIVADAAAEAAAKEQGGNLATGLATTAARSVGHLVRRQFGIGRRVAGEVALWPADPSRAREAAADAIGAARSTVHTVSQLTEDDAEPSGSPLWRNRSRHRQLEHVRLSVDDLKLVGRAFGGSVNDVFLAGLNEAAYRYHDKRDVPVTAFNSSFVLSTRTDNKASGNAFTPVPVRLAGGAMSPEDRVRHAADVIAEAKEKAQQGGGISGLSAVVNLLPTSVVTRVARSQSARIDFATSNLRGAPFPLFCAGAEVQATICMGPVAGTAANITALSHNGNFDMGLFIDPVAIDDPRGFRDTVEAAFADLIDAAKAAGGATTRKTKSPRDAKASVGTSNGAKAAT